MLSLRRLSPMCWFVGRDNVNILLTAHLQDSSEYKVPGVMHVCAALVSTDTEDFTTVVVDKEVWSTSLFTVTPFKTLAEILQDLNACGDFTHPVELIYRWGGQLHHLDISIVIGETIQ